MFLVCSLAMASQAIAAKYSDPEGFSFTHPDTWVAINKINQNHLPKESQAWLAKNSFDLNQISALAVNRTGAEFEANLSVVVSPQPLVLNDRTLEEFRKTLPRQFKGMGMEVDQFEGQLRKFGENETIAVEYVLQIPGIAIPVRQRQVYFSGGGKTHIVTCTDAVDQFDETSPAFDSILASFTLPESKDPAILHQLKTNRPFLIGFVIGVLGVVGIIVGGLAALLWLVLRAR